MSLRQRIDGDCLHALGLLYVQACQKVKLIYFETRTLFMSTWTRRCSLTMGVFTVSRDILYGDNLACIAMSQNPVRRKFSRLSHRHQTILCARTCRSWVSQARAFAHTQNCGWRLHQELAVTGIHRAPTYHDWPCSFCHLPLIDVAFITSEEIV